MTSVDPGEVARSVVGDLVAIESPGLLQAMQQLRQPMYGTRFDITVVRRQFLDRLPRVGAWAKKQWRVVRWRRNAKRASGITQGLTILDLETARELIRSGLVFPFGHPMPGHVYVRHPVERSRFLCFAQFHEQILTEKATEGARLLLALGARDITVEWDTSSGKKAKGEAGVELPELGRIVE